MQTITGILSGRPRDTKKYINYQTSQIGHNDVFSGMTGGRAPKNTSLGDSE